MLLKYTWLLFVKLVLFNVNWDPAKLLKGATPPIVVPACKSIGNCVLDNAEEVVSTFPGILVIGVAPAMVVPDFKSVGN